MTHRDGFSPEVGGLGRKVEKPKPERPEWWPVPDKPHLEQNAQGQLRTRIPGNEAAL